jgi:hypothetical protein
MRGVSWALRRRPFEGHARAGGELQRCHRQAGDGDNANDAGEAMTGVTAFDSPRLTLKRAKHHIHDLKDVIGTFTIEHPWSYVIDSESQAPNYVYKIKFHTPPPADAACILFDAVNNLRATLDQIGYSAAVASGKIKPRGTNFPFGKDKKGVEAVFKKNQAHLTLPPQIMDLFRSVEPYRGGSGQVLWAINRLCNTKKHSELVPTMVTGALFTAVPARSGLAGSNWMPNELELILMVVPHEGDHPDLSGSFSFTVSVDLIRDKPIVVALEGAVATVAELLFSAEAICQKLGFLAA